MVRTSYDIVTKGILPLSIRSGGNRNLSSSLDSLFGSKSILEIGEHVLVLQWISKCLCGLLLMGCRQRVFPKLKDTGNSTIEKCTSI